MNIQSPRFSLNSNDGNMILAIVIHGLIGIAITVISEVLLKTNYGIYTPYITTGLTLISLVLKQYLDGPSQSSIKIQQLEQLVQQLQGQLDNPSSLPQNQ